MGGLGDVFQAAQSNGVQQEANARATKERGSEGVAGRCCAAGATKEAVVMLDCCLTVGNKETGKVGALYGEGGAICVICQGPKHDVHYAWERIEE